MLRLCRTKRRLDCSTPLDLAGYPAWTTPFVYAQEGQETTHHESRKVNRRRRDDVGHRPSGSSSMQTTMETTTTRRTWIRSSSACFVSTISPDASNRRSRTGWGVESTTSSRISAVCCGLTRSTRCTGTIPAAAATRPRTASATRSRLRSASTTTASSVRTASARAISAGRRSW